jgi:hypothetical protein
MCAYGLGVASSSLSLEMSSYFLQSLQVLSICISNGDDNNEIKGTCTDTACTSVCKILVVSSSLNMILHPSHEFLWGQVLSYLPIKHDIEEALKTHDLLITLLLDNTSTNYTNIIGNDNNRYTIIFNILLEIYGTKYSNNNIDNKITQYLKMIMMMMNNDMKSDMNKIMGTIRTSLLSKFDSIISRHNDDAFSPIVSAPIHDILMRR